MSDYLREESIQFLNLASNGTVQDIEQYITTNEDPYEHYYCTGFCNEEGQNALHLALRNNDQNPDVAVRLYTIGISLTSHDMHNCMPVHYAAKYLRTFFFEKILSDENESVARDLMCPDDAGNNILHYCFGGGKWIDFSNEVDSDDERDYEATDSDKESMYTIMTSVQNFLTKEDFCGLISSTGFGETPLFDAVRAKCLKAIAVLCNSGAKMVDDTVSNPDNKRNKQTGQKGPTTHKTISLLTWYLWHSTKNDFNFEKCMSLKTPDKEFALPADHIGEALIFCARLNYPPCQGEFDIEFKKLGTQNTGRAGKRLECAKLLLEQGTQRMGIHAVFYKQEALVEALCCQFWNMAKLLLRHGATVKTAFCDSAGLLHRLIEHRLKGIDSDFKEQSIRDVIENYDLNVNDRDENGQTPLHYTTFPYMFAEDVEESPLESSGSSNGKKVILSNKTVKQQWNRYGISKELIQLGSDVDAIDKMGFTPLMRAVENDFRDLVVLFLEYGANPYHSAGGIDAFILAEGHPEKAEMYKALLRKDARKKRLDEYLLLRSRQLLQQVMKTFDKENISETSLHSYQRIESAHNVLDTLAARMSYAQELLSQKKEAIYSLLAHHVDKVLEKLKDQSVLSEMEKNEVVNSPEPCGYLLTVLPCMHPDGFSKFVDILEDDLEGRELASSMRDLYQARFLTI